MGKTRFGMKEKSRIGFAFLKVSDIQMEILIKQVNYKSFELRKEAGVTCSHTCLTMVIPSEKCTVR